MAEQDEVVIFRDCEETTLDMSAGYNYTYEFKNNQIPEPGPGLNPAALASSNVTGKTLSPI
jgi:hypothetical protein